MASRDLVVHIIGDDRSLQRAYSRSTKAGKDFERQAGRTFRGAIAGSGAFRSLGRSVAFASSAFLGGVGLTAALRSTITAAQEQQQSIRSVDAQLKAAGKSWQDYAGQINTVTDSMTKLGIENDAALRAFTTLFRATGNVDEALRDLHLTADIAAARHIDLQKAALLVSKVEAGNTGILRRYGVVVSKTASVEEALAVARQKFAGQAAANVLPQEKFAAILDRTQEIIGTALLPTLNKYLTQMGNWLDRMNKSGDLQKNVNQAVGAFRDVLDSVRAIVVPLVHSVGGLGNALKLAFAAFLITKTSQLVTGISNLTRNLGLANTEAATLNGRLKRLSAQRIVISVVIATQIYGPGKKFFEQHLGADFGDQSGEATADMNAALIQALGLRRGEYRFVNGKLILTRKAKTRFRRFDQIEAIRSRPGYAGAPGIPGAQPRVEIPETTLPFRIRLAQARGQTLAAARQIVAFIKPIVANLERLATSGAVHGKQLAVVRKRLLDAFGLLTDAQTTIADAAKNAAEKQTDSAKKSADAIKEAARKQHEAAVEAARKLREATDRARQQIGELFQGPVLAPSEAQRRAALGFRGPDIATFTADIRAQTNAALISMRNQTTLRRRGAPQRFIDELVSGGRTDLLAQFAGAPQGALKGLFAEFRRREAAARRIAERPIKFDIRLYVDKREIAAAVTTTQQKQARGTGKTRRGNQGGQVLGN